MSSLDGTPDIHEPFTTAENIRQLCFVDGTTAEIMAHVASALSALGNPSSATDSATAATATAEVAIPSVSQRLNDFQAATEKLLHALHTVDVHTKRQLWALGEAGIIRNPAGIPAGEATNTAAAAGTPAAFGATAGVAAGAGGSVPTGVGADGETAAANRTSLVPDGMGVVGGLDAGWLNSRIAAGRAERDLEAEQWAMARAMLEGRVGKKGGGGGGGDVAMGGI